MIFTLSADEEDDGGADAADDDVIVWVRGVSAARLATGAATAATGLGPGMSDLVEKAPLPLPPPLRGPWGSPRLIPPVSEAPPAPVLLTKKPRGKTSFQ